MVGLYVITPEEDVRRFLDAIMADAAASTPPRWGLATGALFRDVLQNPGSGPGCVQCANLGRCPVSSSASAPQTDEAVGEDYQSCIAAPSRQGAAPDPSARRQYRFLRGAKGKSWNLEFLMMVLDASRSGVLGSLQYSAQISRPATEPVPAVISPGLSAALAGGAHHGQHRYSSAMLSKSASGSRPIIFRSAAGSVPLRSLARRYPHTVFRSGTNARSSWRNRTGDAGQHHVRHQRLPRFPRPPELTRRKAVSARPAIAWAGSCR